MIIRIFFVFQETGWCDCHANVGSGEDDKCCTCTPGYFDFTPHGCQGALYLCTTSLTLPSIISIKRVYTLLALTPPLFLHLHLSYTACGCSELSVSGECDIVSGQCQCQEGAIGLKCDDCAFGYFGNYHMSIRLTCLAHNMSQAVDLSITIHCRYSSRLHRVSSVLPPVVQPYTTDLGIDCCTGEASYFTH